MVKISVVVPVYNEEAAIKSNIEKLTAFLSQLGRPWELVLVNDGSTDNTLREMKKTAEGENRINIISYTPNRGRGFALKTGFRAASGEYIIATESDLNWGVEIIGRFAEELDKGKADVVIASPHMRGGRMENVPLLRKWLSYFGNRVFALALPGLTMTTGMTRGYRREVLDAMDLESDDKELHVEILSKARDLGFRIAEIPAVLRWRKPAPGVRVRKSHFKFKSIFRHLLFSFDVQPYILFGAFGFLLIGIGVILGLYLLVQSLSVGVAGRPLLFVFVLCLVIGFQVLVFGFLASQNRDIKRQLTRFTKILKELKEKD